MSGEGEPVKPLQRDGEFDDTGGSVAAPPADSEDNHFNPQDPGLQELDAGLAGKPDGSKGGGAETLPFTEDPVHDYFINIGRTLLLSAEQEVDLAKTVEAGLFAEFKLNSGQDIRPDEWRDIELVAEEGRRAKDHLLEANLRLVVSFAKRYRNRGLDFLDLIQEGNLGLVRAVKKFDYTRGNKFSTYAAWDVCRGIERAIANQARMIRIPVYELEEINKLYRIQRDMTAELQREPTIAEIAAEMDTEPERVLKLMQESDMEPDRLERPIGEDEDDMSPGYIDVEKPDPELGEHIGDGDSVDPLEAAAYGMLRASLETTLKSLSERESGVIALRFGLVDGYPKTLDEIGKIYGLTRERIRQIEAKAMIKLRHPGRSQSLRDYWDG